MFVLMVMKFYLRIFNTKALATVEKYNGASFLHQMTLTVEAVRPPETSVLDVPDCTTHCLNTQKSSLCEHESLQHTLI